MAGLVRGACGAMVADAEKSEPAVGSGHNCKGPARLPAMLVAAALCALAGVLRFALRGYDMLAYVLAFTALLVALRFYAPGVLFKMAVGLAVALTVAVCITEVSVVSNARTDAGDDVRFVVVLGAKVDKGGTPSLSLLLRLRSTLDFLEEHPQAPAVLSGGQGEDEDMPEGQAMYAWLVDHGVSPNRLIVENRATNTRENLKYSFDIIRGLGYDPSGCTAVVSSSYHLYRAKLLARQLGVEVSGVAANPGNPFVALNYFIREAPAVWKELLVRG